MAIGTDGRIASKGSLSKALSSDKKLAKEVAREAQAADKAEETIDDDAADKTAGPADSTAPAQPSESDKDADGKLIVAEEISEGHVGWPARKFHLLVTTSGSCLTSSYSQTLLLEFEW